MWGGEIRESYTLCSITWLFYRVMEWRVWAKHQHGICVTCLVQHRTIMWQSQQHLQRPCKKGNQKSRERKTPRRKFTCTHPVNDGNLCLITFVRPDPSGVVPFRQYLLFAPSPSLAPKISFSLRPDSELSLGFLVSRQ